MPSLSLLLVELFLGAVRTCLRLPRTFTHRNAERASADRAYQILQIFIHRIYRITYLLYFSPLRHFPGPKLWACSRIPGQISALSGREYKNLQALHRKYGPVVRTGPKDINFFTAQSFKDIYVGKGAKIFKKDASYYTPPPNDVNNITTAVDEAEHARQRRILAPGFSGEALRSQEGLIMSYVDAFILGLTEKSQKGPVEVSAWFNYTTFDITGDLMFGESFGCLRDSRLHPWIALTFDAVKAWAYIGAISQFPMLEYLLYKLVPQSILQKEIDHFNLSVEKVNKRIEMGSERHDIMSNILKAGLSEKQGHELSMSRAEIHSNAFL
jgi:cytochrome P450